ALERYVIYSRFVHHDWAIVANTLPRKTKWLAVSRPNRRSWSSYAASNKPKDYAAFVEHWSFRCREDRACRHDGGNACRLRRSWRRRRRTRWRELHRIDRRGEGGASPSRHVVGLHPRRGQGIEAGRRARFVRFRQSECVARSQGYEGNA